MTTQLASVSVEITNGQPTTTSLDVATHFGKQHKDVLRAIATLKCSPEFSQRNFAPVEYTDSKGETRPAVRMTRDGFTFLCMGFTGKEAAKWKEAYIDAFNRMEAALKNPAVRPATGRPADHQPMTLEQRQAIINAAHVRVCEFPAKRRVDAQDCLRAALNAEFGASVCADARQFADVIQFIKSFEFNLQPIRRGRPRKEPAAPAATTTRAATPDTRPTPLAILAMDTASLAIEGIDELLSCCASVPPRMMATARMYRELLQLNWNDAHAARLAMVPA